MLSYFLKMLKYYIKFNISSKNKYIVRCSINFYIEMGFLNRDRHLLDC